MEATSYRTNPQAQSAAAVAGILIFVLAALWQTTRSMADVWAHSGTYAHGWLVVPAFLWMLWRQRGALADLPVQPTWPALLFLAGIAIAWIVGELTAAAVLKQFALVATVPAAVATILGAAWVRALRFPFVFLFFAVPFGDSLIPVLMTWTADFAEAALRLSGIPVYREGTRFSIPGGDWSVVDACSGIRYVFACCTVSALYAWTAYRKMARRVLFILIAGATAVLANFVRAYAILVLAHLTDHRLATGIDHAVYGWTFFAAVMASVFSIGAAWREALPSAATNFAFMATGCRPAGATGAASAPASSRHAALACGIALLILPYAATGVQPQQRPASVSIDDIPPQADWVPTANAPSAWQPKLERPSAQRMQAFTKDGRRVGVYLAVYGRPVTGSKIGSASNRLVSLADLEWTAVEQSELSVPCLGGTIPIEAARLSGPGQRIVAWHWFWVDGDLTTSLAGASLMQAWARLQGRSELSAWVTVFVREDADPGVAPLVLRSFAADMVGSIDAVLRAAAADWLASNSSLDLIDAAPI